MNKFETGQSRLDGNISHILRKILYLKIELNDIFKNYLYYFLCSY